jgi:hypothetical protein
MEPAHYRRERYAERFRARERIQVRPEVREPAHWFDPGIAIAVEEAVLISVIDDVYPELRLSDRISSYREIFRRRVRPEVMEPVHIPERVRPEVMEPAHFPISREKPFDLEDFLRWLRAYLTWR